MPRNYSIESNPVVVRSHGDGTGEILTHIAAVDMSAGVRYADFRYRESAALWSLAIRTQIGLSRFIYVKSKTVMSNKPQTVPAGRPIDGFHQAHNIAIYLSKKLDGSIRFRAGKEGA